MQSKFPYVGKWEVRNNGFPYLTGKTKYLYSEMSFSEAFESFTELKDSYETHVSYDRNREHMGEIFSDSRDRVKFAGGTVAQLYQPVDVTAFRQREKEIKASKLMKKIRAKLALENVRRRSHSDKDGDFNYDRRWDLTCFERSQRRPQPMRSVEITAHLSFSCFVSDEIINKYGALVTSVCNMLEAHGIGTSIRLVSVSEGSMSNGPVPYHMKCVRIKNLGEYSSPQKILKAFSSNFLRRVLFTHIILGAEFCKDSVAYGLGRPFKHGAEISFENGKLEIFSHSILDKQKQLDETILKIINE